MSRRRSSRERAATASRRGPTQPAAPREPTTRAAAEGPPGGVAEPGALVLTHFFDPGSEGPPYAATVRFAGAKIGSKENARYRVVFSQDELIEAVPGSGPNALSARVYNLEPGEWSVTADVVPRLTEGAAARGLNRARARRLPAAQWSWRKWRLTPSDPGPVRTRWTPLAQLAVTPGVLPGVYPLLVALAAIVAVAGQAIFISKDPLLARSWPGVTAVAVLAGLASAKVWYFVLNPTHSLARGWAVDGFVVVAPLAAALALAVQGLPVGRYLDASMPGLFFGVAIGRVGCIFAGCCSGRCTASPWALWSSDQRIGARRVPTQLLESTAGMAIGGASVFLLGSSASLPPGSVFVIAYATYAAVRQLLLRLRSDRRASHRTVPLTAAAVAAMMAVVVVLAVTQAAPR